MNASIPSSILTALLKHGVKDSAHEARIIDAIKKGPRVTTTDLAKQCKISLRTVWKWIKSGKLPQPKKQGRKIRYWDYEDVRELWNPTRDTGE